MQMTQLRLHRDLSYCQVDGHLIFLDIQNDRYFRLTGRTESALINYLDVDNGSAPNSIICSLIERKILTDESVDPGRTPLLFAKTPTHSAMEDVVHPRRASISELLDALATVCSTQRQLKTCSLKQVLQNLASFRDKQTPKTSKSDPSDAPVLEAASAFRGARLYIPIDTCCLLDSIAMVNFLAKRGLHADLVFGVTGIPFSAHCWAQHGTTVLNDALGHTSTFTPIRVI
jgi:hypothetical protein